MLHVDVAIPRQQANNSPEVRQRAEELEGIEKGNKFSTDGRLE